MRNAETVTFGGTGLDPAAVGAWDRAGNLRGDAQGVARLRAAPEARVLPVWRGKPLLDTQTLRLGWVAPGHPVLAHALEAPVLLGVENGAGHFAADISPWVPESADATMVGGFLDTSRQAHPALPDSLRFCDLRQVMTQLEPREAEQAASGKGVLQWHATHRFCARCGAGSDPVPGGWSRACPACGASHFPRTDPVVIMLVTHGNSVLLGRSPAWPEGMYSLLAGFMEPGETLEGAVRREVWEETAIRTGKVRYLASQPWPFPASLMLGCQAEALSREITIDPVEIERALWLTREELVDVFAGRHPVVRPARAGAIAHFLLSMWLADRLDEPL